MQPDQQGQSPASLRRHQVAKHRNSNTERWVETGCGYMAIKINLQTAQNHSFSLRPKAERLSPQEKTALG